MPGLLRRRRRVRTGGGRGTGRPQAARRRARRRRPGALGDPSVRRQQRRAHPGDGPAQQRGAGGAAAHALPGRGVSPDELVYFEAHGTGTRAGDRAECRAVGRALAAARTRGPLPIGTVKSNLGHLEAASGMPGLLKACLVLRHGHIPASLHASRSPPTSTSRGSGSSRP
ncbi:hypothetical protein CJI59_17310 [Streptomyces sp. Alain-F2R5]|nr:hypothetical protein [Streptomyces sp. Alain-F2R5]PAN00448.1 hypothetical protein CJI59_17310 [Streptomyces sp. Alain-F2R5]